MTDQLTREQELLEEFKSGLSKNDAPQLAQRLAALEAERDSALDLATSNASIEEYLTAELEKLGYPANGGPEDATVAQKAIFALTGVSDDRERLSAQLEDLRGQLDAATARAERAEKSRDRAKAKVAAGEQPAKLRKLAAMDDASDDLAKAIADADKVEVVLSDGKAEIEGVAPIVVTGEAWRQTPNGLMLTEAVEIDGPSTGKPAFNVDGYALVLDGKQVAYRKRPDPVTVVPGQHYKIENDIIF